MKKQTVVVLWSIVILLLIGGCSGVYIYRKIKEKNNSRGLEVFSCMPADIAEYSVSGGGAEDSFVLKKSDRGWEFSEDSGAVADSGKVDSLINAASRITALKTISQSELKNYKSAAGTAEKIISLKLKDGGGFSAEFLGSCKENSAFRVKGDTNLYIMNTSLRDILTPAKKQLSVTAVFGNGRVERIRYEEPDGDTLEIVRQEEYGVVHYVMTSPYESRIDEEKLEQLTEVEIPNMKIEKFMENPSENLENYGLDEKSRSILTVALSMPPADKGKNTENAEEGGKGDQSDQREVTLYLGNNSGGLMYAMKAEDGSVVAVRAAQPELLRSNLSYLLENAKDDESDLSENTEK